MDGHQLQYFTGICRGLRKQRVHLFAEPIEVSQVGALGQAVEKIEIGSRILERGFILNAGPAAEPQPGVFHPLPQWTPPAFGNGLFDHGNDSLDAFAAVIAKDGLMMGPRGANPRPWRDGLPPSGRASRRE